METLHLTGAHIGDMASMAADVLRAGGVVLFPTDTLYGLGADAFSNEAVDKVYMVKGRDEGKPVHALVSGIEMAAEYAQLNDDARLLAGRLPKGKVTFICKKNQGFDTGIGRGIETFGFRIPDNALCLAMVGEFGRPVTATSANRAGEKPQRSIGAILKQLGGTAEGIDLVIDGGELPPSEPSTVVDLSGSRPVILREGAVSVALVWDALGEE